MGGQSVASRPVNTPTLRRIIDLLIRLVVGMV